MAGASADASSPSVDRVELIDAAEPSVLERRILEFETAAASVGGVTAASVRREFGVTLARYHQMLSGVLDSPQALRHDPMLVRRLRRIRDARAAARASRTFRLDSQDTDD
ncbi:DUF3263 domain-containing protein [Salinibacterium sp. ZJ70]|uniref:DUF3263 domain-containing protein n=1 Tax=Salinibacterium sp. ZJ70 TaxID=2708084 RepID=UPI00141DCD7E|nr:DUF3263 domain-containing protein [Salinibacterium sp. ZJ70]